VGNSGIHVKEIALFQVIYILAMDPDTSGAGYGIADFLKIVGLVNVVQKTI
jgi:hypothetical protein